MSDTFEPISTQEELNAIIRDRLARDREAREKKYADYDDLKTANKDLTAQLEDLKKQLEAHSGDADTIKDLQSKVQKYETDSVKTRIAHEKGLGYDAIELLTGDDEESITKSAEKLAAFRGKSTPPPLSNPEGSGGDGRKKAFQELARSLNNRN